MKNTKTCNFLLMRVAFIAFFLFSAVFVPHQVVNAATCTVTTNADSGTGSLRAALEDSSCTLINFDGDYTINLSTTLTAAYSTVITGEGHTVELRGNNTIRVLTVTAPTVELHHLTIANGGGVANGAGIYNTSTLLLDSVTITSIHASGNGAAIYSTGDLTVNNSTIYGNTADIFGGGIYGSFGSVSLNNDTFSQNSASTSGADIYALSGVTLSIHNTIMGNSVSGGDCNNSGGTLASVSNNLIEDSSSACGMSNGYDGNIIGMDPYLNSLGNNGGYTQTAALQGGSAAIDAGDSATCMANDQRGILRNQGSTCDIGAYEYVDTTAPSIDEIDIPSTSSSLTIPIGSWGTIEDAHIYGFLITESSTPPDYSSTSWNSWPVSGYTVPTDGTYYLYPWVRDASGHVSPVYGPVTVVVNTTVPPVVMIEILIPDPTNDDAMIAWNANQTGTYSIRVGGTDCSNGTVALSGTYGTVYARYATNIGPSGFVEGVNTVRVCLTNSSGVTGSTTSTVTYDITAPTVTISDVSPDPTTSAAYVTWSADESGTYTIRTGGTSCSDGSLVDTAAYTSPASVTTTVTSGYLASGSNTIRICLTDAATNTGYDEDTVTYSGSEPSVIITYIQAPTNSYSWVGWYASANGSVEIRRGGTNCSDGTVVGSPSTYSSAPGEVMSYIAPASLLDGANIIRICLTDGGGRTGFAQRTIIKDTTLPNVYIDNVTPNPTSGSTGVYWHMEERVNYDVRVGGTTCSTGTSVRSGLYSSYPDVTRTEIDSSYLTNGVNDIIVCATDASGNVGSASTTVTFDSAPTVNIVSITPNPTNSSSIIRFGANESGNYAIRVGATCSSGTIVTSGTYATPDPIDLVISSSLLSEGANPIVACVTDSFGNTGLATRSLTYDTTAPVVTIDTLEPALTNHSPTITGHADETGTYSIRVGGSDCSTGVEAANGTYASTSDTITQTIDTTYLSEGGNTIRLCVADSAGNWGSSTGSVVLDTTNPSISIASLVPNPTNSDSLLTWSANESGDYWIQLTGPACDVISAITTGTYSTSGGPGVNFIPNSELVEGENPVWVCLNDAAGNTGSYNRVLVLDSTPPTVGINSITPDPTNADAVVDWYASEDVNYVIRLGATGCTDGTVVESGVYSGPSPLDSTIPSSSLSEGTNSILICVTDQVGFTSSTTGSVVKDTVAPAVTITNVSPNPTDAGTTITWTSDVAESAAVYVGGTDCDVDPGTLLQSYSGGGITGYSTVISASDLPEGYHQVRVCVTDAAGNVNFDQEEVIKDTTAPVVTIDSIIPNPTNGSTIVYWYANEIGSYEIRLNGTSCTDGSVVDSGNYTTSPALVNLSISGAYLSTGSNTIMVCLTDEVYLTGSASDVIVLDTTPPTVTINSLNPNPAGAATTVNWSSNEDGTFEVRLDATNCTDGTLGASGSYTSSAAVDTLVNTSSLSDGTYSVYVCNTDAAGNLGYFARSLDIDTTAPVVSLSLDKTRTNSGTTAIWSADDSGSFSVRVGGTDCSSGTVVDGGTYASAGTVLNTIIASSYLTEGTNVVRVCVTNALGNPGSDYEEVVLDVTAPALILDDIDHSPTNTDVNVTWTVDSASLVLLFKDSTGCSGTIIDSYTDVTGTQITTIDAAYDLTEGVNSFELCAMDDVDNQASRTFTITLDTLSPDVYITSALPDPTNSGVTVYWTANENGDYTVRVNSTDCTDGSVASSGIYLSAPSSEGNGIVSMYLSEGSNSIRVCLTDDAGNTGFFVTTVVKDTTSPNPVINSALPNPTSAGVTVSFNAGELNSDYSLLVGGTSCTDGVEVAYGTDTTGLDQTTSIAPADLAEGSNTLRLCSVDAAGNEASVTTTVVKDTTAPTAVIDSIDPNPTSGGATVTWHASENGDYSLLVGGSDCSSGIVVFNGSYTTSPLTVDPFIASTYLAEGTNTIRLCFVDQVGLASSFTGTVVKDSTAPSITSIMRQDPAGNPTNATSVTLRVTFGEDMLVSTIDVADFILNHTGTAAGTLSAVNSISDAVYDVVITGVSGDGNLSLGISTINNITDASGNSLGSSPSIGTSQSYTIDNSVIAVINAGVVGNPGSVTIQNGGTYHSNFTTVLITFDSDAADPAGNTGVDDVTNPNNYILLQPGITGEFVTIDCMEIAADDTQIPTGPVVYDNNGGVGPFTATLTVNGGTPLAYGRYRLLICGTTSIVDLLGRPLNDGADEIIDFSITADAATIPLTGFAQNRVTYLPEPEVTYTDSDLWLEIPALGVEMDIVGIPQSADGTWDVSWLGEDAGWLAGTAYPTLDGNSVITGHVWNADNTPGPFNGLSNMRYGQQIIIHANGVEYVYEVRSVDLVGPNSAASMLRHQNTPWLTLVTCVGYNESTDSYRYRVLVRAVLVEVH